MARRSLKKFLPKRATTFGLNITSMTDMFTIMLVFLLQTYSTADVQIEPEKGMRMPSSNSELTPVKGIKISASQTELKVNDKVVSEMKNLEISKNSIDAKDTNFIQPLFAELDKLQKESNDKDIKDGKLMLIADGDIPYQTLRKIFYTASMAGFPQLKMITVVGN